MSNNNSIFRPEREAQILRGLEKSNDGPLTNENLRSIFREIISSCLSLEKKLKISCLGPEQSYSNIALVKFFGSSVNINFYDSINSIFDDVILGIWILVLFLLKTLIRAASKLL